MIEISVFDGACFLLRQACRPTRLANGDEGVLFRGLAYPLVNGERIDLAGPAEVPGAGPPQAAPAPRFLIVLGDRSGYLFVAGSTLERETAAAALRGAGAQLVHSGRHLGDPIDDFVPDWFIRFDVATAAPDTLEQSVAKALAAVSAVTAEDDLAALRAQILTTELLGTHAQLAAAHAESARLRVERAEALSARDAADAGLKEQLEAARLERDHALSLAAQASEAAAAQAATPPAASPTTQRRLRSEIETVLRTLLPHVELLRDSLAVITTEYRERGSLYRALGQLSPAGELPANWKKVRALDHWWERHVADGASDAGRLYARWDATSRTFAILVSRKQEQSRDFDWLRTI